MKRILNSVIVLSTIFVCSNSALANFDSYMYYQLLEANQNNGVTVSEVTGSKYNIFKEKTKQGITERKFNTNNYKMVSDTDYDKTGQIRRIREIYELVDLKVQNNNIITIDMYLSDDKTEKHTNIAFDSKDNLPAYLSANKTNTLTKIDGDMTLRGQSLLIYKNNVPLKMILFLSDESGKKCTIYLNYTTGELLTEKEYGNLH